MQCEYEDDYDDDDDVTNSPLQDIDDSNEEKQPVSGGVSGGNSSRKLEHILVHFGEEIVVAQLLVVFNRRLDNVEGRLHSESGYF